MPTPLEPVVLLSGGVDSAVVAATLVASGGRPDVLFVDYGQPAAPAERVASAAVAGHLGLPCQALAVTGLAIAQAGEIAGRNDLLIAVAAAASPGRSIAIGVHAGTGYADCSPAHQDAWQALLDVQHHGTVRLLAPLIALSKGQVYSLALSLGLPIEIMHSCEAAELPCGECRSCLDRAGLLARP